MSLPIIITAGNAVQEVRTLFDRPDLNRYFPLVKTELGPEIKFFGNVSVETRELPDKTDDFYMLGRRFGWAVALVLTNTGHVLLNVQPKPGLDSASLEMPAGGIGKDPKRTEADIISLTKAAVLKETGYGRGIATYLGFSLIETGKMFDPATQEPFVPGVGRGLKAHCILIQNVRRITDQDLAKTEKIQPILVTINDLFDLVRENVLVETSAINCFTLAMLKGGLVRQ